MNMDNTFLVKSFNRWIKIIEDNDFDKETYQGGLAFHYKLSNEDNMYRVLMTTFREAYGKDMNEQEQVAFFFAAADVMKTLNEAIEEYLNEE